MHSGLNPLISGESCLDEIDKNEMIRKPKAVYRRQEPIVRDLNVLEARELRETLVSI